MRDPKSPKVWFCPSSETVYCKSSWRWCFLANALVPQVSWEFYILHIRDEGPKKSKSMNFPLFGNSIFKKFLKMMSYQGCTAPLGTPGDLFSTRRSKSINIGAFWLLGGSQKVNTRLAQRFLRIFSSFLGYFRDLPPGNRLRLSWNFRWGLVSTLSSSLQRLQLNSRYFFFFWTTLMHTYMSICRLFVFRHVLTFRAWPRKCHDFYLNCHWFSLVFPNFTKLSSSFNNKIQSLESFFFGKV